MSDDVAPRSFGAPAVRVEERVLRLIDAVTAGRKVEDARVELKAEWPKAEKAARQIAGHANASRGEPVLWVIGLDERGGVVDPGDEDVARWWTQVQAQFSGSAPAMRDITVHTSTGSVVALLFDASRAPFVVWNPARGRQEAGPVLREVPWREGTSVRSATREDLVRLLVPTTRAPEIEVLKASVRRDVAAAAGQNVVVYLELYIVPRSRRRIVLPFHRASGSLEILTPPGTLQPPGAIPLAGIHLGPPTLHGPRPVPLSKTVSAAAAEAIVDGPGALVFSASAVVPFEGRPPVEGFDVRVSFTPALADLPVSIQVTVRKDPAALDVSVWRL